MPKALDDVLDYFRRAVAPGEEGVGDGDLLTRFIERRDEVAWNALVWRHAPMVWGVCRRALGHTQDAEDAFQTTFIVLVRRATAIAPRSGVGNWLHGVAHNTAVKAKATAARRAVRERQVHALPEAGGAEPDQLGDLRQLLDRELARLPDKYRAPIVLCDLEGRTFKEAAGELGWPEGTLSGRLSRARKLLAGRLKRTGAVTAAGPAALGIGGAEATAAVPLPLVTAPVTAGWRLGAGLAMSGLPPAVAALTREVSRAMFIAKLKWAASTLLVGGVLLTGLAISARQPGDSRGANQKAEAPVPPAKAPGKNTKVKELQKERLAILRQIADQMNTSYKSGTTPLAAVLESQKEVLAAELELCEANKERVAVLNKQVELARQIEKATATAVEAHSVPKTQLLKAQAHRLAAEIEVEKAKAASPD